MYLKYISNSNSVAFFNGIYHKGIIRAMDTELTISQSYEKLNLETIVVNIK